MSQRVLIVDDEEIIRLLFTDLLADMGFEVDCVCDGSQAVRIVQEKDFDMIFSDVHMPVMNGVEAMKTIKTMKPWIPIVMMDSYPDKLVEEMLDNGALDCIHKPFDIELVRNFVRTIGNAAGKDNRR
jgi:CheY-like chemotaxis protein